MRDVITIQPRRPTSFLWKGFVAIALSVALCGLGLFIATMAGNAGHHGLQPPTGVLSGLGRLAAVLILLIASPILMFGMLAIPFGIYECLVWLDSPARRTSTIPLPARPPSPQVEIAVVARAESQPVCPFCKDLLDEAAEVTESLVECAGCRVKQHLECIREARGRCSNCRLHLRLPA